MKLHGTMKINGLNHLEIGGCDTVELAETFGTPLYIMDEALIRENCRAIVKSFCSAYPDVEIVYAAKAFFTMAMAKIIEQEGLSIDVVSGGELYTAYNSGFPMDRVYFHGNNKSPEELRMAVEWDVAHIVIDNMAEMDLLERLAVICGKRPKVLIRVSPGVTGDTHQYIQTGQLDSKFGFPLFGGMALDAALRASNSPHMVFEGLHCHIGSQILDIDAFTTAAGTMTRFAIGLCRDLGITTNILNLGGGYGVCYTNGDKALLPDMISNSIAETVKKGFAEGGIPLPRLVVEPGRFIVGNAGTTLYTVGSTKEIPGVRKFVFVDGGMADNPRPALYNAKYRACVANNMNGSPKELVTIAGKCCESGDILVTDASIPRVDRGDLVAILTTGAYNYSMSSNYNRLARPAAVLVNSGRANLIIKRETYDDIIRNDIIPERLR
jgi:diaminopimelate decarboxylase